MKKWVDSLDALIEAALQATGSTAVSPIYGGLFGALILVDTDGRRGVLKLIPPVTAAGQINALQKMSGRGCPSVYQADVDAGWILLEEIDGTGAEIDQPLNLEKAYRALSDIWASPLDFYHLEHTDLFESWLKLDERPAPNELKEAIDVAHDLMDAAPEEQRTHIHGDIGAHNLMQTSDSRIIFVDPSGALGPASADLGSLAAWSGSPKKQAVKRAIELARIAGVDPVEPARWAIVRVIASGNLGHSRGANDQYRECIDALEPLLQDFAHIQG